MKNKEVVSIIITIVVFSVLLLYLAISTTGKSGRKKII